MGTGTGVTEGGVDDGIGDGVGDGDTLPHAGTKTRAKTSVTIACAFI